MPTSLCKNKFLHSEVNLLIQHTNFKYYYSHYYNIFCKKVTILGVYGISQDEASIKKEEFYRNLNNIINKIGCSRKIIIIMGDFNGRTGNRIGTEVVGPHGEERVNNDNGERLIELCVQYSLKIKSGFYQREDIRKYTRYQGSLQQRSIIDYIIIKNTGLKQHLKSFSRPKLWQRTFFW